jgi:hypothetical protein
MDFIGFTERIDEDMRRLLEKLGRPYAAEARKRVNAHPAVEDLSETIRAMLRQRTQEDRKVYEWALQHAS